MCGGWIAQIHCKRAKSPIIMAVKGGVKLDQWGREDREGRPGAVCGFDLVEPLLKSVYIAVKEM